MASETSGRDISLQSELRRAILNLATRWQSNCGQRPWMRPQLWRLRQGSQGGAWVTADQDVGAGSSWRRREMGHPDPSLGEEEADKKSES